jgi:hypothetical protein
MKSLPSDEILSRLVKKEYTDSELRNEKSVSIPLGLIAMTDDIQ